MKLLNYVSLSVVAALCSLSSISNTFAADAQEDGLERAQQAYAMNMDERNDNNDDKIAPLFIGGKLVTILADLERFKQGHARVYHNPSPEKWQELFLYEIKRAIEVAEEGGHQICKVRMADDPDYGRSDSAAFFPMWPHNAKLYLKKYLEYFPSANVYGEFSFSLEN